MNVNQKERLRQIQAENNIWIIYLGIIALSYYSNALEKDFFTTGNQNSKVTYRKINIIIFTTLLLVYAYFEKDTLNSFLKKEKSERAKVFDTLSLVGSTAILIAGIIFLYIAIEDKELEEEIAFN